MKLRQRGDIWDMTHSPDGRGGWDLTPVLVETGAWMNILPLSSRERLQYQQLQSEVDTRIIMRYREGLGMNSWVARDGVRYEFDGPPVVPNADKRFMEVLAKATHEPNVYIG